MLDEFVVWDSWKERFVLSIDTFDGDVDYTADPAHARIFHGATWWDHWEGDRWGRMTPAEADGNHVLRGEA